MLAPVEEPADRELGRKPGDRAVELTERPDEAGRSSLYERREGAASTSTSDKTADHEFNRELESLLARNLNEVREEVKRSREKVVSSPTLYFASGLRHISSCFLLFCFQFGPHPKEFLPLGNELDDAEDNGFRRRPLKKRRASRL